MDDILFFNRKKERKKELTINNTHTHTYRTNCTRINYLDSLEHV